MLSLPFLTMYYDLAARLQQEKSQSQIFSCGTHFLCPTHLGTLFLEESLLALPLPFLTMYDEGKLICATLYLPYGGTYFVS